jgi:hypothetical protein
VVISPNTMIMPKKGLEPVPRPREELLRTGLGGSLAGDLRKQSQPRCLTQGTGLACLGQGVLPQASVEDGIGDLVAVVHVSLVSDAPARYVCSRNRVGVAFSHRFGGEEEGIAGVVVSVGNAAHLEKGVECWTRM